MGSHTFGVALAVATILLFSLKAIFAKFAYAHGVDSLSILGLRMLIALPFFLVMALVLRRRRDLEPMRRRDAFAVAGLGIAGYYLSSWFDFIGLQYLSASLERLLLFSYPTLVVVLSAVFFGRPITSRAVISLLVTYLGVVLCVVGGPSGELRGVLIGAAFVIGSALIYAFYLVFGAETIRRVGAMRFTTYAMLAACVPAITQWIVMRPTELFRITPNAWFWAVMLAFFATVLPIFGQSAALRRIGANQFAILGALGPVATILVGAAALGERMTLLQWIGAAAVVGGVMIVSLKPSR